MVKSFIGLLGHLGEISKDSTKLVDVEMILAVLWVRDPPSGPTAMVHCQMESVADGLQCCASAYLSFSFTDSMLTRW